MTFSGAASNSRIELARAAQGIYSLLARIFGSLPTVRLVRSMREEQMLDSLAALGISFEADFLSVDEERLARELSREYTRLFTGPGTHIAAYESVYVRGEGETSPRLWGQATGEVAEFYRELGLEVPEGKTPDHLGLELEAMAVMTQAQADRLAAGDDAGAGRLAAMQERFCREHLLRWIPAVCRDVEQESDSSFYRSMASLAAGFVEMSCTGVISGNLPEEVA
ncbi:MAG: molecular chaperone TorD family protein [Thermoleophilia bacterium]|nr:molecular chaperone TorD family protein [Thermoleophilia bacterium]